MVKLTLDRERRLQFDMNAIVDLERATGWDLPELSERMTKRPSATLIRAFLWAGLRADDPGLTIEQAGAMLTPKRLKEVWPKVIEAFSEAFAEDDTPSPSLG